jgi:alkanesulfonate monooxygenase SsuD/methylene tetrahydromethanopterin reductase-like flavin-dependent oxidoreductase (luciferase family)
LSQACVGSPETIAAALREFIARTQADELIIASQVFDHAARLRSYEIVAEVRRTMGGD